MLRYEYRYDLYPTIANVISWEDRFDVVSFAKSIAIETRGMIYRNICHTLMSRGGGRYAITLIKIRRQLYKLCSR